MNYAEDRLDRKARGSDIWNDFCDAIQHQDDVRLAGTLRDVGWVRHAVFHYSRAWFTHDHAEAVGDYAQMTEFAGFPEMGILALLHFRNRGQLGNSCYYSEPIQQQTSTVTPDSCWLQRDAPRDGHCGCGIEKCGQSLCEVPLVMEEVEPILAALEVYVQSLASRTMPTTHEVLTSLAKDGQSLTCSYNIPELLQFWKGDCDRYRGLSPVLQLLLLKQLYLVFPTLAAEAVVHLKVDEREMAASFKSHNAYYALIRAVVLGERIKPHRRKTMEDYHVPVWDILWGHDGRHGQQHQWSIHANEFMTSFRNNVEARMKPNQDITRVLKAPGSPHEPLFVVGDSHVLSTAWQTFRISTTGEYRTLVPIVVTGLKAWHCRLETRFFTQSNLQVLLQRLPSTTSTILVSAGEIDCREGLGGSQLEGYDSSTTTDTIYQDRVESTVQEFVTALTTFPLKVLLLPVCPHVHRSNRNGKAVGRAARRQVTRLWNEQLRRLLPCENVTFLDYEQDLLDDGYVLKRAFNADGTHMNSAFLRHMEAAFLSTEWTI